MQAMALQREAPMLAYKLVYTLLLLVNPHSTLMQVALVKISLLIGCRITSLRLCTITLLECKIFPSITKNFTNREVLIIVTHVLFLTKQTAAKMAAKCALVKTMELL